MAIIIPSKNIYENPKSNKVLDNFIDKIETKINKPVIVEKFGELVHTDTENIKHLSFGKLVEDLQFEQAEATEDYVKLNCSYVSISSQMINVEISIPISKENYYIKKILVGKNKENENNIRYSVRGTITKGKATRQVNQFKYVQGRTETITSESDDEVYSIPYTKVEYDYNNAHSEVQLKELGNVDTATASINGDDYVVNLSLIVGIDSEKLGGDVKLSIDNTSSQFYINGDFERYEAKSVEINFYGNTLQFELQEQTTSVGTGENIFTYPTNELLQTTNAYNVDESMFEKNCNSIINSYKNGKETMTLTCSIGDYKDENGEKVISVGKDNLPMSFSHGDIAIPMKRSYDGVDIPRSVNSDGTPKEFIVTGINYIYDGACWQKLNLQEI